MLAAYCHSYSNKPKDFAQEVTLPELKSEDGHEKEKSTVNLKNVQSIAESNS